MKKAFILFSLLTFLLPASVFAAENSQIKYVALTFDDGPHAKYTPIILDILKKHDAKATFFVLGQRLEYEILPEIVKQAEEEGHAIGSHMFDHAQPHQLSKEQLKKQISRTNELIYQITGNTPAILRPPYGQNNTRVTDVAAEMNMSVVLWNIDPRDSIIFDTNSIINSAVKEIKDGDIIILHDIFETSVNAVEPILKKLSDEGFTFVTVPELISIKHGQIKPGETYKSGLEPCY